MKRLTILGMLAAFLVLGVLLVRVWRDEPAPVPVSAPKLDKVYFVPIGTFSYPSLSELADYYGRTLHLTIEILSAIEAGREAMDETRGQFIGEELINLMKQRYPQLANDQSVMLIGVTPKDMYIREYTWQFAFAIRDEGRFVVVACYRMNPEVFGLPLDSKLFHTRIRKIITKNIGMLYFGLPQSTDRKSVLFGPILGLDDLDSIGEDFGGQTTQVPTRVSVRRTAFDSREGFIRPEARHPV